MRRLDLVMLLMLTWILLNQCTATKPLPAEKEVQAQSTARNMYRLEKIETIDSCSVFVVVGSGLIPNKIFARCLEGHVVSLEGN